MSTQEIKNNTDINIKVKKEKFIVQWHITHKCNLRCTHCYQEDYNKDLSLTEMVNIFTKIKEFIQANNYKCHINFTGGEPFLSKNIWQILNLAEKEGYTFGILTNGTIMNNYILNRLSDYKGLSFIQISLDGTKETHNKIRGNGTYEKALKTLRILARNKINTMVSFTCHKDNLKDLKKVIKVCKRNKVDIFWSDRLIPTANENSEINKERLLTTKQFKEYTETLAKEKIKAERNPLCKTEVRVNRALQFISSFGDCYECSAGKRLIAILADGTLLPCRRLPIELGKIDKDTNIQSMLDKDYINIQEIPNDCKNCELKMNCRGGAKCLTYATTGTVNNKDINCWLSR